MFKLIGVTGKTGSGKSTFSDMLAENANIGVIHVDDILKEFKLKYLQLLLSKDKNGEKTKINSNLKTVLYGNKLIFNLFMKFRAKIVEKAIDAEIQRLLQEGNETIIIDDIFIKSMKRYKDISKVYIVKRPYTERKEAIKQRDGLTREEIVAVDLAHHKENYKEIYKDENVEIINNNGTQEDLKEKANQVYNQYFKSFKERYKEKIIVDNTVNRTNKNIEKDKDER